jgi:hypothetical protein
MKINEKRVRSPAFPQFQLRIPLRKSIMPGVNDEPGQGEDLITQYGKGGMVSS